jgi:hypothetical protein
METIQNETIKIYKCSISPRYTQYYIEVHLIAANETEAKKKFISKCLENYSEIINTIDFEQFYNESDFHYENRNWIKDKDLPLNFPKDSTAKFEKYLNDDCVIECLNDCSFEIINAYD